MLASHLPGYDHTPQPAIARIRDGIRQAPCRTYSGFAGQLGNTLTRTLAAQLLALAFASAVPPIAPAFAAIPSISEYDAVQYRKPSAPPPRSDAASADELPPSEAEGLRAVSSALQRAGALIDKGEFDTVRSLLREPLFARFLGYTPGVRGGAANLRPAAALVTASRTPEALSELLLDLKRLDDFCLSNRVIVFNVEDLEQVKALMAAPTQKPEDRFDRAEVMALLEDARDHLAEAQAALK